MSTDASARSTAPAVERDAADAKPRPARPAKDARPALVQPLRKSHRGLERPPFECVALVLQGGGALGAFQAGVYQALVEANLQPDWVAGISIGAINAALIAGNAPHARLDKLHAFWEQVTAPQVPDLVDFDRINSGVMRFSVGAVNIRSGNFVYFNSNTHTINTGVS